MGLFKKAGRFFKKVGKNIADTASDVKDGFKGVGKIIEGVAEGVAGKGFSDVKKGVKKIGNSTKDITKRVSKSIKSSIDLVVDNTVGIVTKVTGQHWMSDFVKAFIPGYLVLEGVENGNIRDIALGIGVGALTFGAGTAALGAVKASKSGMRALKATQKNQKTVKHKSWRGYVKESTNAASAPRIDTPIKQPLKNSESKILKKQNSTVSRAKNTAQEEAKAEIDFAIETQAREAGDKKQQAQQSDALIKDLSEKEVHIDRTRQNDFSNASLALQDLEQTTRKNDFIYDDGNHSQALKGNENRHFKFSLPQKDL